MSRIAKEGILFAYGATEPEAGSDLTALKTTAEPVGDNGTVTGYRITGAKQWISNGGVADLYTVLALAPGGPSWFVVESGAEGFTHGKHEDKHGIRLSNTAALFLNDVYVDADRLIGGVEGQGLVQAQQVFGYTRLMVAAFGLGAGWSALDRAIPYSRKRIQAGAPLSEKQGYTHKLIVPHAIALEAARAAIEETASASTPARARSTSRARSPSTSPPRRATRPPTRRSRRTAATATRTTTWSRRSSATFASPGSTRAPRRSWR